VYFLNALKKYSCTNLHISIGRKFFFSINKRRNPKSLNRVGTIDYNNKNMKKLIFKTVELLTGAKVHADHTAIKGRKSGGIRDNNGVDWKTPDNSGGNTW